MRSAALGFVLKRDVRSSVFKQILQERVAYYKILLYSFFSRHA